MPAKKPRPKRPAAPRPAGPRIVRNILPRKSSVPFNAITMTAVVSSGPTGLSIQDRPFKPKLGSLFLLRITPSPNEPNRAPTFLGYWNGSRYMFTHQLTGKEGAMQYKKIQTPRTFSAREMSIKTLEPEYGHALDSVHPRSPSTQPGSREISPQGNLDAVHHEPKAILWTVTASTRI